MKNKKVVLFSLLGFLLLVASAGILVLLRFLGFLDGGVGTIAGREFAYGLRAAFDTYIGLYKPASYAHPVGLVAIIFIFVAVFSFIINFIMALAKKKGIVILPAFFFSCVMGFIPYVMILAIPMIQMNVMRSVTELIIAGVFGLLLFAAYFEFICIERPLNLFARNAGEAKPAKKAPAGLTEAEVKAIVEEYLADHIDEMHQEPVPAPVKEEEPEPAEEPVEEEPVEEEPVEEEEEADEEPAEDEAPVEENNDNLPAGITNKGKRRKASFETRLKNSEFDIRHKYYDLRDYIKWYGLKNRISIPGDTFSYKRQRYVFLTIVGKHIRVYVGLDPDNYIDSTIPVETVVAKKYEDLPCLLKVKSDLSYRRAKKLVDDLMAKLGIPKPDEDEPKETQKDE